MEKKIKSVEKETYISPAIEVVEIEIEQNILAGGSSTGDGGFPNGGTMPNEPW